MQFRNSWIFVAGLLLAACGDAQRAEDTPDMTENAAIEPAGNGSGAGSQAASDAPEAAPEPATNLATDNVAFLVRVGLIRGHLHAGNALYQQGAAEMAATHMKHPRDELYAGLVPAIEARGLETFDAELTALAEAVESGAPAAMADEAWRRVDEAIESIERGVDATASEQLRAIAGMLDTAAEEYAIGVFEGMVQDPHEYQDSWGFQQIALQRVGQIEAASDAERSAKSEAAVAVSSLDDLWPELDPNGRVGGDADRIGAAAERIRSLADASG